MSQSALWDYVNDFVDHSNVAIDVFGTYGAQNYYNVPFSAMSGADYLNHINAQYFVPDHVI